MGSDPPEVPAGPVKRRHQGQVSHDAQAGSIQGTGPKVRTTLTSVRILVASVLLPRVSWLRVQWGRAAGNCFPNFGLSKNC